MTDVEKANMDNIEMTQYVFFFIICSMVLAVKKIGVVCYAWLLEAGGDLVAEDANG